jgi:hypothetical protein
VGTQPPAPGSTLVWTTETPPCGWAASLATIEPVDYVVCRYCGYERPVGEDCGLPCV